MRPYISASTAGRGLICDTVNILSPDPRPRLSFTDDGPGKLSVFGPRHDNDNENYRKIKILPTADEILAVHRPTYMPKKDLSEEHFLDNGPGRLLDTLFRQLRYDSTENIRDICYSASQIAFLGSGTDPGGHVRQETGAGNRYFLYNNVKIEELLSHEQMAMVVRVSYDCPPFMRAQKLYDSGRFQKGMLVALLQLNHATMKLSVYFLEVHLAQSTFSMECFDGRGTRAAVQLSFLPTTTHDDVLQLCRHALGLCEGNELYLVEFPKVLFAGFYNCLKRLQQMAETDFAFQSYVAPDKDVNGALLARNLNSVAGLHSQFPCPPPSYALSSDFAYNLTKLVPLTCPIASASVRDLSRPSALDMLSRETTLDEGQAVAFRDSLLREYACTQGPPGCGKTFLGVQLTKTLLDSRPTQKPILLVCLTNHALDSFLADLRDAGVSNLLRVGSASKEDWTDAINLRSLRRKTRMKKENAQMLHANGLQKKLLFAELDSLCKALSSQTHSGTPPWHYVEGILRNKYPDVHSQFMTNPRVSLAQSFTFEYWSGGGDLKTIRDLHLELACRLAQTSNDGARPTQENVDEILLDISYRAELQSANAGESSIWNLPLRERQSMLRRWEAEVDKEKFADKMASLYSESRVYTDKIKTINDGRDVQIMSSQNIIAMTTTACAARWELLRSVDPEILICEEAAEVMEAHALCTLLPSLKHAIFIGDPQQLRPETNEQSLSLETSVGRQYRLDESLLERLMFPHDMSASVIPSSHLSVQRRMHPDIANITRLTYPYLTDHESTLQRSPTHGIAHRVFWWDHRVPELESDDLKSHANLHEVEMVASLVEYLLRSGAYSQGEVAVLTPYAGQLLKLYERLATTCDIWLSEKDREALLGEEILGLGDEGRTSKDEVAISDMLRIATVDNFQGEEAKVIILSTVRSGGTAGFLKTLNRINVACSRARNGFYIVGNSQTLSQVPRWREVINALSGKIGGSIMTQCHVHPDHRHLVEQPEDFRDVPECSAPCGTTLPCGHICQEKCHPPQLHSRLTCQEKCAKVFQPCGHKCEKLCYQRCGKCDAVIDDATLDCSHHGKKLCSGDTSKCEAVVEKRILNCGHSLKILCGEDPDEKITCQQACCATLTCGHPCSGKCGVCNNKKQGKHESCTHICNRLKACGHFCKETCHVGNSCPRSCVEPCLDRCEHGPCRNRCQDICDPCVKQTVAGCEHEIPSDILCCLPSLSLPCCQPCPRTLECGHACPSFHGEKCPPPELCSECLTGVRGPMVLYAPKCGHIAEIAQLDARNLHGIYKVDDDGVILSINSGVKSQDIAPPKCLCGESLHGIRRYRLHSKLVAFKNTFDLLLAKIGRKLAAFATVIEVQEKQLDRTFKACVEEIRPNPLAAKSNASLVLRRNQEILDLQKNIINFRSEVVDRIQSSITVLHKVFPNVIPSYDLSFHLHLDVLECRVVGVRLADALKLANQLLPLQDPSFGVQRLGLKMIQFAYKESISCANYCQGALGHSLIGRNSSLEAEIRLQQLQFMLFAKTTRAQRSELGPPVDDNVMLMNGETVKVGLEAVNAIGRRSPGTCTGLMATAQDIAIAFEHQVGSKLPPIPKIKNDYTRQVENLWGRHQLGYLVMCCRSHPYSAKTFSDGCPYCEKQAQLSVDEIFRESGKHLFEEQFLQIMHSRAPMSHKSDHHDPERAKSPVPSVEQETSKETATSAPVIELTAEERFLAAMRRGPPKIHAGVPSEAMKEQSKAAVEAEVAREVDIGAGVEMKVEVRMDMQESIAVEPEKELTMEEKFLVAMRKIGKADVNVFPMRYEDDFANVWENSYRVGLCLGVSEDKDARVWEDGTPRLPVYDDEVLSAAILPIDREE
ncbi:uncharacterized protein PV07_11537 [Cladophialophora immunda]|uniref:NF-X1-type domain-containing protein n=1 Tax=Cladophialophora immunda TaxID=569365 RepID=A0A0D2CIE8_9EURO|nr:uncharacterized protein PV07_11537 [Cladophialophora immunda]KIW23329.1 hypothetical protein PV07_11537 [Cladophialophora immunda]